MANENVDKAVSYLKTIPPMKLLLFAVGVLVAVSILFSTRNVVATVIVIGVFGVVFLRQGDGNMKALVMQGE